jgi:CheY-like chemotaxis protein
MDIKKPFGKNVRAWRSRLGISQEMLAERAGLHRTYVCDVERGTRNVSLESISKLARALEISIPSLLSNTPDLAGNQPGLEPPRNGGGMLEILLVEDEADDVELTVRALKKAGISNHIQTVRDGVEALNLLIPRGRRGRQQPGANPQLILLDLKLPKIDGLEVLRQIKEEPRTRDIPVIVLTASVNNETMAECRRLGANAFIPKPVNLANLSQVTPELSLQWALLKPE